jgi:hypothetical protein
MKKILLLVLLCLSTLSYGNEVILLSPYPPGGPTDRILRIISRHLTDNNISNILEYKPGAGGIIAANSLARYKTNILMLPGPSLFTASYMKNVNVEYNISKDFNLVHIVGIEPTVLVVKKSSNITYKDILNNPSYIAGTPGLGTSSHIATMLIKNKNSIVVPFKGENEQLVNIIGGHVTWGLISEAAATQHIDNTLKPILTWSPERIYLDVPTAKELGINDYNFYRLHILISNNNFDKKLMSLVKEILKSTAFKNEIKDLGIHRINTNEEMFLKTEQEKISNIFKEINSND